MKKYIISLILVVLILNIAYVQPLFRLNHPLWPQIFTDNNQHLFSANCGKNIDVINLFSDGYFNSYEWDMGNGVTGTKYNAEQPGFLTGRYDISLKVKKDQKFRIIKSIKVIQTNSAWIDCGFEITPDLYLEVYDSLNKLIIRTNPKYNTSLPVTWSIGGLLAKHTFTIKVKEADTDIICTDDNVGFIKVPANFTGGIIENINDNLKLEFITEDVNETTFTNSVVVSIQVQSLVLCKDNKYQIGLKDEYKSYLWSDGSEKPFLISETAGTYRVTVTDFNNCIGQTPITLNQLPKRDPEVTCENNKLVCTNFTSFIRWLDGDKKTLPAANSITYLPTKEGIYYAESWNGPCKSVSQGIHWPSCNLVNINDSNLPIPMLYPNPASDFIQFSDIVNWDEFKIFNIYGKHSLQGKITNDHIDITSLFDGVYFLYIFKNKTIVNRYKLFVKK